jgi:hypothetical protein
MSIVKLDSSHVHQVRGLFESKKYMGREIKSNNFSNTLYNIFCNNYLSDLKSFHAYGYVENDTVKSMISFYESNEEPSWYMTLYRADGAGHTLKNVLDAVINREEELGRLKFYTLVQENHSKLLRRFLWSKENNERYGYFDEYLVPAKHKTYYSTHWELLYKRYLLPDASVVRCNYLKQEYRTTLPVGGNI